MDYCALVILFVDPHPPGARLPSRPSLALDERLATMGLWERPPILDEPRDSEGVPPKAWWALGDVITGQPGP